MDEILSTISFKGKFYSNLVIASYLKIFLSNKIVKSFHGGGNP